MKIMKIKSTATNPTVSTAKPNAHPKLTLSCQLNRELRAMVTELSDQYVNVCRK